MLRRLFTSVALSGMVFASCQLMSGCVFVIDADGELDCVSEFHGDGGPQRIGLEIDHVDAALAGQLNIKAERATLVRAVSSGWPADRAGVHQFDVITKVDGSDDASPAAVQSAIRAKQVGQTVTLTVMRNAQPMDLTVTIESTPAAAHDDDDEDHDDEN